MIGDALEDDGSTGAWFVTAWGKQSGLGRLAPSLKRLRAGGGKAEVVLGVDEGGATIEGLRLAHALFDSAWIFHDPGARTFHPKMYAVQSEQRATLVIGSGNLTRGGLFTNYEIATAARLDLADPKDASHLADARSYFDRLLATDLCRPLNDDLIDELRADPRILLLSEKASSRARARRRSHGEKGKSVFGTAALGGLLGAPPLGIEPMADESDEDDDVLGDLVSVVNEEDATATPPAHDGEQSGAADPGGGFFKALSGNDVSLKDSPGQIIIPIAFLSFFGDLEIQKDESAKGGPRQSHRELSLLFRDGESEMEIDTGRVILYEPAANHPRQNSEVRFTFRNREILTSLARDDVLRFRRGENGVVVERHPAGWRPEGVPEKTRYGLV